MIPLSINRLYKTLDDGVFGDSRATAHFINLLFDSAELDLSS